MMPGALLLGNAGDPFTCGHEHGAGDRCVSFSYSPEFYEGVKADSGIVKRRFETPRLAPLRALSPLISKASELLAGGDCAAYEELAIQVLAQSIQIEHGIGTRPGNAEPSSLARVTRVLRMIDHDPDTPHNLNSLAEIARLSPYHFLRVFEGITGSTPHQYLLRVRLRRAAVRLRKERGENPGYCAGLRFRRCFQLQPQLSGGVRAEPARVSLQGELRRGNSAIRGEATKTPARESSSSPVSLRRGISKPLPELSLM